VMDSATVTSSSSFSSSVPLSAEFSLSSSSSPMPPQYLAYVSPTIDVKVNSELKEVVTEAPKELIGVLMPSAGSAKPPKPSQSPSSPSGKKVLAVVGAIIGTASLFLIAAPVVIPAAVTALGFSSTGIVAGTVAATIMSSSGGAVAAGSACAVMQSIGATGAISAAVAATAAGTGAVVGGTVATGVIVKNAMGENGKNPDSLTKPSDEK